MYTNFEQELENFRKKIINMATLVEEAVKKSIDAFILRDSEKAQDVIDGDTNINCLEIDIDEHGLRLLALKQPIAVDLRFIAAVMRINVDLERIGDQAVNIAERALELNEKEPLPFSLDYMPLVEVITGMLREGITSFINRDTKKAICVCKKDDTADALYLALVHYILDQMAREFPAIRRSVTHIIISRCLERIADLATNIAESTIFLVEGKNPRHSIFK